MTSEKTSDTVGERENSDVKPGSSIYSVIRIYTEEYSYRYLFIRTITAFLITAFIFLAPILAEWGYLETDGSLLFGNLQITSMVLALFVLIFGGWPLMRLAGNGIKNGFFTLEISVISGAIIVFALSLYGLISGTEFIFFGSVTAIIAFTLLYEYFTTMILDQVVENENSADDRESPMEKRIKLLSKVLGVLPILVGAGAFLFSRMYLKLGYEDSILRAAVVILIAGPGSILLSTRFTMMVALNLLRQNGIILRENALFRKIYDAYVYIFTKWGIITEGSFQVTDIGFDTYGNVKPTELLRYAGALEMKSEHPVAKAFVNQLKPPKDGWPDINDYTVKQTTGVEGKSGDKLIRAGRRDLFVHVNYNLQYKSQEEERKGKTVLYMGFGDDASGAAYLEDPIRPGIKRMAIQLHEHRKLVCLMSGDSFLTVQSIAEKCRIKNFIAEASSEEKLIEIRNHQRKDRGVAVIGDANTDSELFKQADLAIALQKKPDTLPPNADISVKPQNLRDLPLLTKISRMVLRTVHTNCALMIIYNAAALSVAFMGWIQPLPAAIVIVLFHLLLTLNSRRLRKTPADWS